MTNPTEVATLGAGCFWCVDTLFRELRGRLVSSTRRVQNAKRQDIDDGPYSGLNTGKESLPVEPHCSQIRHGIGPNNLGGYEVRCSPRPPPSSGSVCRQLRHLALESEGRGHHVNVHGPVDH